jgi:hypothetical protein
MTRCWDENIFLFLEIGNVRFPLSEMVLWHYYYLIFTYMTTYLKINLWPLDNLEYTLLLWVYWRVKWPHVIAHTDKYLFPFFCAVLILIVPLFFKVCIYEYVFMSNMLSNFCFLLIYWQQSHYFFKETLILRKNFWPQFSSYNKA